MTRPLAAVLFAAAALLVATSRPGTTQTVPTQTAHWQPPVVLSKADAARFDRMLELLEQIERNTSPAKAVKAGPDRLAVAKAKCSACHTPAKADAKGGRFVLFADDKASAIKPLNARERTLVKEAVESGAMPPGRELTPAEKSALTK